MTDANLVEIFCILDEFCKYLEPELKNVPLRAIQRRFAVIVNRTHVAFRGKIKVECLFKDLIRTRKTV